MASRHSCPVRYLWTDIPSGTSVQRMSKAAGSSSTATNRIELPAKLQSISISRQLALKIETPCHLRVSFRQAGMVVAGRGGDRTETPKTLHYKRRRHRLNRARRGLGSIPEWVGLGRAFAMAWNAPLPPVRGRGAFQAMAN